MLNVWLNIFSQDVFLQFLSYLSDTITEYNGQNQPLFTPSPLGVAPMNIYSPLLSWLSKTKIQIFFLFPKQTKTTWHACFTFPFIFRTPLVFFGSFLLYYLSITRVWWWSERHSDQLVAPQVFCPVRGWLWLVLDGGWQRVHETEAPLPRTTQKVWTFLDSIAQV